MTATSRVCASTVAIVHFVLEGIRTAGFPPNIVHEQLSAYLGPDLGPDRLSLFEITFDLGSSEGISAHRKRIQTLVKQLKMYARFYWN